MATYGRCERECVSVRRLAPKEGVAGTKMEQVSKQPEFGGAVRNPPKAQVRRLIARILHPTEGLVLCHLDAKVARVEDLEHFRRWARGFHQGAERVQIFSSFSVHRGGRSMLDVQLKALQLLLASPIAWDYYVNLSDTHYPAEAMSWVGSYLWLHRGVNYARITSTKFYDPTLQGGKEVGRISSSRVTGPWPLNARAS
ncbi:Protein xylosyltransferase [Durusdinium trenchii]|uniref:Protein xylosyltransferase n=1 Tax=Durusdinium trenchii TaxID=1381693 RepID=A0ABP0JV06_9DINO